MVTDLATLIKTVDINTSDTGIEELVKEIGLTSWSLPSNDRGEEATELVSGIDEELIYSMGYTLGGLPGNIGNSSSEYCNKLAADILHSDGSISYNELQNKASIYLIGYQSGLRAR
jgi:hypothetical protein